MKRYRVGEAHEGKTNPLSAFLSGERSRIYDAASPARKEQLRAAERQREVFRAWNEVCAGTREGAHVTGLFYMPERNELVAYADTPVWAQELSMLREIIRARMEMKGVRLERIVFKASRAGYAGKASSGSAATASATYAPAGTPGAPSSSPQTPFDSPVPPTGRGIGRPVPSGAVPISSGRPVARPLRASLSPDEEGELRRQTSSIPDEHLRHALQDAMRASFEWKKGSEAANRPI